MRENSDLILAEVLDGIEELSSDEKPAARLKKLLTQYHEARVRELEDAIAELKQRHNASSENGSGLRRP